MTSKYDINKNNKSSNGILKTKVCGSRREILSQEQGRSVRAMGARSPKPLGKGGARETANGNGKIVRRLRRL